MQAQVELENVEILVKDIRKGAVKLRIKRGTEITNGWFEIGEQVTIHYPTIRLDQLKWRAKA